MKNIYGLTFQNLENYFLSIDDKKYRAKQIYEWLYKKKINNIEEITNIKKETLDKLAKDFSFEKLEIVKKQEDVDVKKYLLKLVDDNLIEVVLMKHNYGNSICISTQVGCNMGCVFCESGKYKKARNLDTSEMVLQVMTVLEDINERIDSVVLMGIGEPLDNYDNVMDFIRIINDPKALEIGIRHITLSTCGIIPKIEELMNENMQINLAISLHAPNDELRSKIMPINKVYKLEDLMKTLKKYIEVTNRRLTFEYIMLDGLNDSEKHALELCKLLKGINGYVNLIPYNKTSNSALNRAKKEKIMVFYDILKKNKINVTIRREFGSNIDGACGQLKNQY